MSDDRSILILTMVTLSVFLALTFLISYLLLKEYLFSFTMLGSAARLTSVGLAMHAALLLVWLYLAFSVLRLFRPRRKR
jgi:hypothetical protein